MTCEDCLHEKVCGYYAEFKDDAGDCTHFKNKAEFVEVVRCKDCKHMRRTMSRCYCLPVFGLKRITDLNAYCSYGKRKSVTGKNVGGK